MRSQEDNILSSLSGPYTVDDGVYVSCADHHSRAVLATRKGAPSNKEI